jgi:ABC-type nitrate/sulfonate/bicarbonate transport system permease component
MGLRSESVAGIRFLAAVREGRGITGELVIRSPGIGRQIALAQSADQVDNLYALVIVAGLIGVIVNLVVRRLEAKTLHWHPSVTGVER